MYRLLVDCSLSQLLVLSNGYAAEKRQLRRHDSIARLRHISQGPRAAHESHEDHKRGHGRLIDQAKTTSPGVLRTEINTHAVLHYCRVELTFAFGYSSATRRAAHW